MRLNRKAIPSKFSILTVDDDPLMTSTIQAYFTRNGYEVDVENNPSEAIERVRNGKYDILLLDFLMTPICGDQVIKEIREFNSEIFIILLTGHKSMAPPIKSIRELDIQGYYEKSDRFDQLELLVESCTKSIKQMRTIREYQKGLSVILDELPRLYQSKELNFIIESILNMAVEMFDSEGGFVIYNLNNGRELYYSSDNKVDKEKVREKYREIEFNKDNIIESNSHLIAPLTNEKRKCSGIIAIAIKEKVSYQQKQLMQMYAKQVSAAISNSYLHEKLNEALCSMKTGYLETITTLRLVVETKDIETRGHSDRVSQISSILATKMGMNHNKVETIRLAGLFHDIGKIGVPDWILLKPGKLTAEEYEEVKKHPETGANILMGISGFKELVPIVRGHHERIDGKGYPDGKKGNDIPIEARIIAVADALDAMVSKRSYRDGMSIEVAIEELRKGINSQFDGQIVEKILEMYDDLDKEQFVTYLGLRGEAYNEKGYMQGCSLL